jgi:hypothetical protein
MAPEIAAFIRAQPRAWGYARLAEACRAAFGGCAPDAEAIRAWWLEHGKPPASPSRLSRDPEIAEAIHDLAGRVTVAEIMRALAERFPAEPTPSRSALYRYVATILRPHGQRRADRPAEMAPSERHQAAAPAKPTEAA